MNVEKLLGQTLVRIVGVLGILMGALFFLFALKLYRDGQRFGVSAAVCLFLLVAGLSLLKSSFKKPGAR